MTDRPHSRPSSERRKALLGTEWDHEPKVGVDDEGNEVTIDTDHLETPGQPRDDEPTENDIGQADFGDPQRED